MKHPHTALVLATTLLATPSLTGFVLLGNSKSKLGATPENPTVFFEYYPEGDVPSISKKEELLDGIYANLSDRELMPVLLQLAMDQWNNVRGSYLRMEISTSTSKLERSPDDRLNVIVAEKNKNASTAAFAMPNTNPDNRLEIYDCDISISTNSASAYSILETLTHELGHCVGLGHPHNNYGAIMSYSRTDKNFHLGPDDKAGAIFLYPDPNYVDGEPKELIGCGNIGGTHQASALWLVVLLFLPMVTTALQRTKPRGHSRHD